MKRLILIHTVSPLIEVFNRLCSKIVPGVQVFHILDEPLLRMIQEPISLETPVNEDEESFLRDLIEDKQGPHPLKNIFYYLRKEEIRRTFSSLSNREAEILTLRHGLDGGYPRTLEEVGEIFGVTRERVRQIEAKAIRKLRHPSRSKSLKEYID